MRIGYFFHGFLGDDKFENGVEVSTPDGNAAYSWSIIFEAGQRGHEVIPLHRDRDAEGFNLLGSELFSSFSKDKRLLAYKDFVGNMEEYGSDHKLPELDVVLIEWRWPIHGRNCEMSGDGTWHAPEGYSNDLLRQWQIIKHYNDLHVPIILWDLDHKLTYSDERKVRPAAIFETSLFPRLQHIKRTQVEPPFIVRDLLQHKTLASDKNRKLVYIGSRYERDDVINEWIKPVSDNFPTQVEFWGKWDDESKILWPNIDYHARITMKQFRKAYGRAVACPILAKKSYFECGFITPRPYEAILFGTIPIGLSPHMGISRYVSYEVASSSKELSDIVQHMSEASLNDRHDMRECIADKLTNCDASNFIDEIENVVNHS